MRILKRALGWGLAVVLVASLDAPVRAAEQSPALKELVAAANKDGNLELQWGSNLLGGAPAAWYMAHPEAMAGLKKALPILINR